MKKGIKFSGLIAAVFALIAFILQLASPAVVYNASIGGWDLSSNVAGTSAIFGTEDATLSWAALLAWIFVLVAFVALICDGVLPRQLSIPANAASG